MKEHIFRQNLTSFIGKSLKSRQEKILLVRNILTRKTVSHVVKEMFLKVMNIILSEMILPKTLKSFYDSLEGNLFFDCI